MKPCRLNLILLVMCLVFAVTPGALVEDVNAAPPQQSDMEAAIIQALEATARELGMSTSVSKGSVPDIYTMWDVGQVDIGTILVTDNLSEQRAITEYNKHQSSGFQFSPITFHGYPGLYLPYWTAGNGQVLPDELFVRIGRYSLSVPAMTRDRTAMEIAEIFYRHAVVSGFMKDDGSTGFVTPLPTVVLPTVTPLSGMDILLSASKEGYQAASQVISNAQNLGTITITGVVRDAQTGSGIEGAVVQVVSGASPASALTGADGSYALAVSVPGGSESGEVSGLDFDLQITSTMHLVLQSTETSLPADGVSTTQVVLRVTDLNGDPLPGREFEFVLQGQDGQGSLQLARNDTDQNGSMTATYTSFKPPADARFASHEHLVTVRAADKQTGEFTTLDLYINQNQIGAVNNQYVPACARCKYPVSFYIVLRDALGNPIPDQTLTVRLEGANSGQGTLVTSAESNFKQPELQVQTTHDGSARLYYRWLGGTDVTEVVQEVIITEEQTNAVLVREVFVHGIDLAIAKVEEAGFTGVTNHQAFFKIYLKDRLHLDLSLDRFNLDSPNQVGIRVGIFQFESEGSGTSLPFDITGGLDTDSGGTYVKMHATPNLPYVIPVNDGTTWYQIRVDAVDADDVYIPDPFRGNNDTIIALTTGSPDGWLHIWLSEGALTPHSYFGVLVKCVARFLPGIGDAITAIDTLNQVYNQDVLSLGQSTAQILTEKLQEKAAPGMLTKLKASTLNNVVSCMQDGYGVYKESGQSGPPICKPCSQVASLSSSPSCVFLSEDYDADAFNHALDQFTHGLFLDSPDEQTLVVFGVLPEDVTLLDAQGQAFSDPDRVSAGDGVVVYLLPAGETYSLQVTAESSFEVAVYRAGDTDEARETIRHALQPDGQVAASMSLGGSSDYGLAVDVNGDGAPDQTLQASRVWHDMVRPTINSTKPGQGATLFWTPVDIVATYADNPGGSGVDPVAVRLLVDGQDLTDSAAISADELSLHLTDLESGEHTVHLEVSDESGNKASAEWNFVLNDALSILGANPAYVVAVAVGGVVFAFLAFMVLLVVLVSRRGARRRTYEVQDTQGRWWRQDPANGAWLLWDGSAWKSQAPVASVPPPSTARRGSACLLILIISLLLITAILVAALLMGNVWIDF